MDGGSLPCFLREEPGTPRRLRCRRSDGGGRADSPPGGLEKALLQEGINAEDWREGLRRSILYRKSVEAITRPLAEVTEQEMQGVFRERFGKATRPERIQVRPLLFDSPETAAQAREKLSEGTSPEDVVTRCSTGEGATLGHGGGLPAPQGRL